MNNEIFESANLQFSTADADIVSIESNEYLRVNIIDWKENKIQVSFKNVLAFNYQLIASNDHRDDEVYIINNSEWLKEQLKVYYEHYPHEKLENIKHYKLCFNNCNTEINILSSNDVEVKYMEKDI
jgi:hypothetical protein